MVPEFFQKTLEESFGDIQGVIIYFDLLIYAQDESEHDKIFQKVIDRAKSLNIKLNPDKLQYKLKEVRFLGNIFCSEGIKPDPERIKAINSIENPKNVKELERVLGMLNYLRRYIPNYANLISPVCELLKKNVEFVWLPQHTEILDKVKNILKSNIILANFDLKKKIEIQTDASQSGLGSCLMQEGKPIYYASRALTDSERNFNQIEKEMLAVVYSVSKFHHFIYGQKVTIFTDHKPLVNIINKEILKIPSSRLQRMRIKLLKYDIKLIYLPGDKMHIADLFSRSYCNDPVEDDKDLVEIVHMVDKYFNISDNMRQRFQDEIEKDTVLCQLIEYTVKGWPSNFKMVPKELQPYWAFKEDIQYLSKLLFVDDRLIVPAALLNEMLKLLHEAHFGINKIVCRAKSKLYWPNMCNDIENYIGKCKLCEMYRPKNCKEPMIPHEIPERPFQKLACDLFEFRGQSYLVVFDYFSRWLEVKIMKRKRQKV